MDHRSSSGPHLADARYELLVPDPDELYLARRHLGFAADEWRALPWHEQRAYRDGLRQEFFGGAATQTAAESQAALTEMGVTFIHQ